MTQARLGAPKVYIDEQEDPDHVNKVPIPCGSFKTNMLIRFEMARPGPEIADD